MADGVAKGPRVLLRRLREVMATPQSAQARLDRIARIIAADMVAEVCSIYLAREPQVLELFTTEGLNPEAVHRTKLAFGEGLVGDVAENARPLNLADAQSSPKFAYRPETGEEIYHSLVGVPILRGGQVVGVLVVQNRTMRHYTDEEVEALETTAMVIAEMAAGALLGSATLQGRDDDRGKPAKFVGLALSDGVAFGQVVLHEPRIEIQQTIAEDVVAEQDRLLTAIDSLRDSVDKLLDRSDLGGLKSEQREVLEAYRMFAHDKGWLRRMTEAVAQGLTAEAAVDRVQNETRARMSRQSDPYIRERLHDLDDIANRLLRKLAGEDAVSTRDLPEDAVIVARAMGPAELLDYDTDRVKGLVLEEGSPTSHVAILARAFAIPMVGRLPELGEAVDTGDPIIVDGEGGEIHINPPADIAEAYKAKLQVITQRQADFAKARDLPSVTRDGVTITLNMNAGLTYDLPHLAEVNADGIGLFRTELQFMVSSSLPKLNTQAAFYSEILDIAGDKPVVFRTLDLGGDKILPYGRQMKEENPALGWRAIRIALDRPGLLRYQVRAMLKAAAGRKLNLMFPMIADVSEIDHGKRILDREIAYLRRFGREEPKSIRLGAMLEVPSLAWRIPVLKGHVDFLSVGSNDLLQFFFASDRSNPRIAARYERLSPAVLSFFRHIVDQTGAADIPLTLCGEMAGRPLDALALIALGFRSLSMPAAAIGPVKLMVRAMDAGQATDFLVPHLGKPVSSIRAELLEFAEQSEIPV